MSIGCPSTLGDLQGEYKPTVSLSRTHTPAAGGGRCSRTHLDECNPPKTLGAEHHPELNLPQDAHDTSYRSSVFGLSGTLARDTISRTRTGAMANGFALRPHRCRSLVPRELGHPHPLDR